MKTTVDITDSLFEQARKLAEKENLTMRALIEEALRRLLTDRSRTERFRLKKASFKGKGLQNNVQSGSWELIRDLAYEGHGA